MRKLDIKGLQWLYKYKIINSKIFSLLYCRNVCKQCKKLDRYCPLIYDIDNNDI